MLFLEVVMVMRVNVKLSEMLIQHADFVQISERVLKPSFGYSFSQLYKNVHVKSKLLEMG